MPQNFSAPVHPALVHLPIALLLITQVLDLTYTFATNPRTAPYVSAHFPYDLKPHFGDIARISSLCNLFAVVFAIPAVLSGVLELWGLLSRQAVADKLAKAESTAKGKAKAAAGLHPKVKFAFFHAALMDATIGAAAYGWWIRRENSLGAPGPLNSAIAALSLLGVTVGSWAGGHLVYRYGVGVYSTGALLQEKKTL